MGLNTATIAVHTTPTVIGTFLKHITGSSRRKRSTRRSKTAADAAASTTEAGASIDAAANPEGRQGGASTSLAAVKEWPDEDILYDEGLQIVKKFLKTAKSHTVEELQSFTAMHVPSPSWIHVSHATVPTDSIDRAASILRKHFADVYDGGLGELGGERWWTLRGRPLEGEWIEMRRDFLKRTVDKTQIAVGEKEAPYRQDEKVILYLHGGAYFFSSLDTHRYQIQRHARLLGGRAFAPSYRLAPQYPFPCGLQDALASYLYLVSPPPHATHPAISPANILISGDSAGAGLVLALLCVIRDSGGEVPMPAGATLISPWVDLTHSFRSIMADDSTDYIPSEGFHYRPSLAWPPIPGDGIEVEVEHPKTGIRETRVLDEQIQMYTNNKMISHPLVSLINQGSLGGLCPLMIAAGSGELLRDEQVFLAHKAANPAKYPPSDAILKRYPGQKELVHKFPPTKVQLQMYDGAAHVTPTLSFTGVSKAMYRATANFGLWALTVAGLADDQAHERRLRRARKPKDSGTSSVASTEAMYGTTIKTEDGVIAAPVTDALHELANARIHGNGIDSDSSASSAGSSDEADEAVAGPATIAQEKVAITGSLPKFDHSMIRQRVSVRGVIRPMESVDECETFVGLDLQEVGAVHGAGPILKWLAAREEWDSKYSKEHSQFRSIKRIDREKAEGGGFLTRALQAERPPLASLAGWWLEEYALKASKSIDAMGPRDQGGKTVSGAVAMWMRMGEKDEAKKAEKPKHEAQIDAMQQKLKTMGVDETEQDTLGDQKVEAIRAQLEGQGIDVVPQRLAEVGPAGESLGVVGDRVRADDDNDAPDKLEPGPVKASLSPKNLLLGRKVHGGESPKD